MIKLDRPEAPPELTEHEIERLTNIYKDEGKSVWNAQYIRAALLAASRSKCAYCESNVDEESKYMEVEHFRCKSHFPDLVVIWENLLPSCKRCNGQKHAHNVETDGMVIDPFLLNPSEHLYFHNYRLRARDDLGRRTIEALYLNDSDRVVIKRLQIGESISSALDEIRGHLEIYVAEGPEVRRRNRIVRGVRKLLDECQPSKEYSAVAASCLLSDPDYLWVKGQLRSLDLWNEFEPQESQARSAALLL